MRQLILPILLDGSFLYCFSCGIIKMEATIVVASYLLHEELHTMYMNCPKLKNGKTVVRLVVSFRQKGKKYPTNRTVKTIGQSDKPEEIEEFKSIARSIMADHKQGLIELPHLSREYKINIYDLIGNKRFNKGFEDALGSVYQSLGFSKLLTQGRNPNALNEVLKYTAFMRAYHPSSKSSNSYLLGQYFNKEISLRKILFHDGSSLR